jgi:hypothetical protein
VTVRNGCADGSGSLDTLGGGILNNGGTVTVTSSTISGNSADLAGGGILNNGGTVTVTGSTISGNSASSFGGGISNNGGTLIVINSTISGNSSADDGGGILNYNGTVIVTGSTISGNSADLAGGGIGNFGIATITNSTISGNSADEFGGGIRNFGGTANLSFVTIASNSASTGGGISRGGGTVNIKNSIVGNNTATTGPNCSGGVTAFGANLDTDGTCTGFTTVPSTGPVGLNLGPLQVNAPGTTATHALQAGSAAIDAVLSGQCSDVNGNSVTQDQRGVSRPQGSACDVGAYEARPFTLTVTLAGTGTGTVTSNPTGINCLGDCSESYPENTVVTLTATPASGSTFAGWSGGCSGSSPTTTVTMNADKTCTATFQLPTTGTIVIQKQTTGSGGTFSFTATGTGLPSSFSLTTPSGGGTASQTFANVSPGTKTVTEQFVPGWVLTNLVCSDPDGGTTVNVGTRTATIDLDPGETITCTFTNTQGVTLEGGGNCLQLNLQAQTYRFRTSTGDLFTGSIRFTRRGSVIQFSNLRMPGETGILGGTVNLIPGRGQAVLRTFFPWQTFSITDPNLSDNTCVP